MVPAWVHTGWVTRVGIPGVPSQHVLEEDPRSRTAKRAPEAPSGGWSGWSCGVRTYRGRCRSHPPFGPGRSPLVPSLVGPSAFAASWPIRAELQSFLYKVSQNGRVSPEFAQKACHSPCFQNGLHMSPLDFLRFPFSPAFSCKELMGHFDAQVEVYCQNDEVSPSVHTYGHAKWASDTPTGHGSKLPFMTRSSSDLARYSQRTQF